MSLCPSCRADDEAWRDYSIYHTARPADGLNPKTRTYWVEDYYALVRWQRDLIARICAGKHLAVERAA